MVVGRWLSRGGLSPWTYTHAWRDVPRDSWGPVSVLASTQSTSESVEAHTKGYAAAQLVDRFESETAYPIGQDLTGIPCPEQTGRSASCANCRLCLNANRLHRSGRVILFAAHGRGKALEAARGAVNN